MVVKNPKTKQFITAPCGKCPDCRKRRAQSWVFRIKQEDKIHKSSIFVTLTYDDQNLPLSGPDDHHSLYKPDVQNFFKRLRKNTGVKTFKYYLCGEYGTETWRPHYHAILFDVNARQVEKAWGLGHIYVDDVNDNTIYYTTSYMCKAKRIPAFDGDTRSPEFALMSKGLGANYLTPQMRHYYEQSQITYVTLPGGFKQPLPRYYKDKLYTDDEKATNSLRMQQIAYDLEIKKIEAAGGWDTYVWNAEQAKLAAVRLENKLTNRKKL